MSDHKKFMQKCLLLADKALQAGNSPVGSLLVENDQVLGQGMEAGFTKKDITYHAEIEAIRAAIKATGLKYFPNAILYTSHEPCIMCSYVIRHHRIGHIVMGLSVPEIGGASSDFPILQTTHISTWGPPPLIEKGILKAECELLNQKYIALKKK
ncbi:MAG: nucleoside deaminase [Bacteroidota bacterium]